MMEDRISSLPDAIIHQIFSPLDTRAIVQTGIFSNKWRYLWKSIHTLTFNLDTYTTANQTHRFDFVDRVLFLRDNLNIQKFTLTSCQELNVARLYIWLMAALRLHVHQLHLVLNLFEPFEFPEQVFNSDVKVLYLGRMGMFGIQLPELVCNAGMLTSLKLISVKFPQGGEEGELCLNCAVLENLVVINCFFSHLESLTIAPPLLQNLELQDEFDGVGYCHVIIRAKNLKSLKYTGPMFYEVSLEGLSSLASVELDVYRIRYYAIEKQVYEQRLMKVLAGIYNIKAITISSHLLKTLTKLPDIMERLPDLFHNLKYIKLTNQWDDETCICPIANILEGLPDIETLVWERNKTITYYQDELSKRRDSCICAILEKLPRDEALRWERNKDMWLGSTNVPGEASPLQCVFRFLRSIEIRNPRGFDIELKIMEFLLKRAIALKEIVISTTEELPRDKEKLGAFKETLSNSPRASSNIWIHVQ